MSFIQWGNETPEQKAAREKKELEILYEQAANVARMRSSSATVAGVGGSILANKVTKSGSVLVTYVVDGLSNFQYFIMDVATGKATDSVDSGVDASLYNPEHDTTAQWFTSVDNKGYIARYIDNSTGTLNVFQFILNDCSILDSFTLNTDLIGGLNYSYNQSAYWVLIPDIRNGTTYGVTFKIFDGVRVGSHYLPYQNSSDWGIETGSTATGHSVFYINDQDNNYYYYLMSPVDSKLIYVRPATDNFTASFYINLFGNAVYAVTRNQDTGNYSKIEIHNTKTGKSSTVELSRTDLNDTIVTSYGTGKIQFLFFNAQDYSVPWTIYHHNSITDALVYHVEERGDYSFAEPIAQDYYFGASLPTRPESLMNVFLSGSFDGDINQPGSSGYCKVTYMLDEDTQYYTYTIIEGGVTGTNLNFNYAYPTPNSFKILANLQDGNISLLAFTKGGKINTRVVSAVGSLLDYPTVPIGDFTLVLNIQAYVEPIIQAMSADGSILDSFSAILDAYTDLVISNNTVLIRNSTLNSYWYFNTKTNKFIQSSGDYYDFVLGSNDHPKDDMLFSNILMLDRPNFKAKILSPGKYTGPISLTRSTQYPYAWRISMGTTFLCYAYRNDSGKYVINIYNLQGNLVKTYQTQVDYLAKSIFFDDRCYFLGIDSDAGVALNILATDSKIEVVDLGSYVFFDQPSLNSYFGLNEYSGQGSSIFYALTLTGDLSIQITWSYLFAGNAVNQNPFVLLAAPDPTNLSTQFVGPDATSTNIGLVLNPSNTRSYPLPDGFWNDYQGKWFTIISKDTQGNWVDSSVTGPISFQWVSNDSFADNGDGTSNYTYTINNLVDGDTYALAIEYISGGSWTTLNTQHNVATGQNTALNVLNPALQQFTYRCTLTNQNGDIWYSDRKTATWTSLTPRISILNDTQDTGHGTTHYHLSYYGAPGTNSIRLKYATSPGGPLSDVYNLDLSASPGQNSLTTELANPVTGSVEVKAILNANGTSIESDYWSLAWTEYKPYVIFDSYAVEAAQAATFEYSVYNASQPNDVALQFSVDSGSTWTTVDDLGSVANGTWYLQFTSNVTSAQVRFKMTIDTTDYYSDVKTIDFTQITPVYGSGYGSGGGFVMAVGGNNL